MKELLLEVLGWLGYLERFPVLLQLLISLALLTLSRLARQRRWLGRLPSLAYPGVGLSLLALSCLLLWAMGQPHGLALLLGELWLGWFGLSLLHRLLVGRLPTTTLHQLESRLLRPGYLLMATLVLISELDNLHDVAVIPLGTLFGITLSIEKAFLALLVFYLVLVGCGPPAAGLAWLLQRAVGMSDGSRKATELMLRYIVVGLGLVGVAAHLGVNTTALIAVAGGLSVGLGFGVKEVFSNFVSGLWLLFEGSVRPGDVVVVDGDACEVRQLHLRAAVLWRDRDNAELVVPNQIFFTDKTITYTGTDRLRRIEVLVGAAYRHRPKDVSRLMVEAMAGCEGVLQEPAPVSLVQDYGESAITYSARCWISDPMQSVSTASRIRSAIWDCFQAHGIEIPFPQRVIQWPQPPEQ